MVMTKPAPTPERTPRRRPGRPSPVAVREEARALYVHGNLRLPAIGEKLSIPLRTLYRYKDQARSAGDDWEDARLSALIAGMGYQATVSQVLEGLLRQAQTVMHNLHEDPKLTAEQRMNLLAKLAYAMNMARKSAEALNPKISKLTVGLEVLSLLTRYIRDQHPDQAAVFLDILQPFGADLRRRYG